MCVPRLGSLRGADPSVLRTASTAPASASRSPALRPLVRTSGLPRSRHLEGQLQLRLPQTLPRSGESNSLARAPQPLSHTQGTATDVVTPLHSRSVQSLTVALTHWTRSFTPTPHSVTWSSFSYLSECHSAQSHTHMG